jgi:hypothetical protein
MPALRLAVRVLTSNQRSHITPSARLPLDFLEDPASSGANEIVTLLDFRANPIPPFCDFIGRMSGNVFT